MQPRENSVCAPRRCTYPRHSSSTENKTWAEDEVDKASQPSTQGGEGAANSSSSNERAEGAQTGAGAADEQGNATSGSNDACMETGMYVCSPFYGVHTAPFGIHLVRMCRSTNHYSACRMK